MAAAQLLVDFPDSDGYLIIHTPAILVKVLLGEHGTGDRGEGDAEDTQGTGDLVGIGSGIEGFDEAAGEDADDGYLVDEVLDAGGIDAREVTLIEAACVKAMLERVEVAGCGAAWAFFKRGH